VFSGRFFHQPTIKLFRVLLTERLKSGKSKRSDTLEYYPSLFLPTEKESQRAHVIKPPKFGIHFLEKSSFFLKATQVMFLGSVVLRIVDGFVLLEDIKS